MRINTRTFLFHGVLAAPHRLFFLIGLQAVSGHSGFMPAAFTSGGHLSRSCSMNFVRSAGRALLRTSRPTLVSFCSTSGSWETAMNSR